MADVVTNPKTVRAVCRGCGHEGEMATLPRGWLKKPERPVGWRPTWCTCPPAKGGPYEAPRGHIAKFTYP